MKSLLPLKFTGAISLMVIALVALHHGAIDKGLAIIVMGQLFNVAIGVLTHTEMPDEEWEKFKADKKKKAEEEASKKP